MKRDRKEVLALRREVKRLRKQLSLHETAILDELTKAEEDEEREKEKQKGKEIGDRCIKCNAPAEVLDLGRGGIYRICTDRARCWHRQNLK